MEGNFYYLGVLSSEYDCSDQIKEDEMGRTCSTYREMECI
jgi:hypothetical protein